MHIGGKAPGKVEFAKYFDVILTLCLLYSFFLMHKLESNEFSFFTWTLFRFSFESLLRQSRIKSSHLACDEMATNALSTSM